MPRQPRPSADITRLLDRYPASVQMGWIQGELQRHCYIGPPGALGPINVLCGMELTHCEPRPDNDNTCLRCWERAVWIRNRRAPAGQMPPHQQPDATRPNVQTVKKGKSREATTRSR